MKIILFFLLSFPLFGQAQLTQWHTKNTRDVPSYQFVLKMETVPDSSTVYMFTGGGTIIIFDTVIKVCDYRSNLTKDDAPEPLLYKDPYCTDFHIINYDEMEGIATVLDVNERVVTFEEIYDGNEVLLEYVVRPSGFDRFYRYILFEY